MWREAMIRYRFGRIQGVQFKPRRLSQRVKWNDYLAY